MAVSVQATPALPVVVYDAVGNIVSTFGSGGGTQAVAGTAADGAAASGNPVQIGGVDGGGTMQALLVDTSGRPIVVGAAAAGAAVAGNPVLMGGSDGANARALATDTGGRLVTSWVGTSAFADNGAGGGPYLAVRSDGNSGFLAAVHQANFNGTNYDKSRNNNSLTLLASAARTTNTNSSDQINYNWRGFLLIVDVSSAGTGSITPSIQVKDSISGNYKTIWTAAAALTANGTAVYAFYPGANAIGTLTYTELVQAFVGRTWRLVMTHNNANSITYSASADMLL